MFIFPPHQSISQNRFKRTCIVCNPGSIVTCSMRVEINSENTMLTRILLQYTDFTRIVDKVTGNRGSVVGTHTSLDANQPNKTSYILSQIHNNIVQKRRRVISEKNLKTCCTHVCSVCKIIIPIAYR